ncbi:hypothetical protein IWW51_001049 [Coemansia sp. RSA 2702]|nr:hypothetical protein IWW52_005940 [Coemansia sp. RSA 2704]KAJ2315593.1 hypothetical protein IWW54_000186 [Coemansia sp. RSA 2705]KAJ2328698.1 hypothetical protein IWW51_001049 [Coemansia sp. RSA 2702]KAJ2739084.1 hypothetical protein H4R23_000708 [Coemansia sp. Cherry 401B]
MGKPQSTRRLLQLAVLALLAGGVQATSSALARRHGGDAHDAHDDEGEVDCYASGVDDWHKGLHIGAIFIVLAASGLGVFLPVLGHFVPQLHMPRTALTLGKHLGTGVIIATALIHMLPGGYENLGNPCIGSRMGDFGGWPGTLAMMAIFAMHLIEFVLSNHAMGKHAHSHGLPADLAAPHHDAEARAATRVENDSTQTASLRVDSHAGELEKPQDENCDAVAVHTHHNHVHGASFINADAMTMAERHRISTYILELGICLHSVIIGLTLSVATGSEFKTLLIAICFHQFCEGLALGSRLAEVQHRKNAFLRAALSAAFFMLVTPLGMVIGIGIRYSYAPSSPASLIAMGVLDSLSAGILLYSGLVNLLAEEFGTLEFRGYRTTKKVACFAATFIGAGIMALIGKWA